MTIDDKTREKLQYDISRAAAKISTLSWDKIDKYEYLADEEILASEKSRMIGQAKFTYFPFGKAYKKQKITIEDQGEKQRKVTEEHEKTQTEALKALELNNQEAKKKTFIGLVKERTKEIEELEEKNWLLQQAIVFNNKRNTLHF